MRTLAIDLETYSSVPLLDCGVYKYAESPDFDILLLGYAFDDEPVTVIDLTRDLFPSEIIDALYDENVLKTAFNANFERTCLAAYFNKTQPPEQWSCTAVWARELGLPSSLEAVGIVLGLPEDKQKSKTGRALIRYFSIPCKPTKANGQRARNLPEHDAEKWTQYVEYNRQDVEAERAIRKKLARFPLDPNERKFWVIDQHINDRGVMVDLPFAANASGMDQVVKAGLFDKAVALTGLANPKSPKQLKEWIGETAEIEVDSLNKKNIDKVREDAKDCDKALEMLDIRAGLSKSSNEKYNAMLRVACNDSKARGTLMFYGASRTGRWSGRNIQMQNLISNKMPDKDLDTARQIVAADDILSLEMLYGDIPGTLSQLIRTAFVPSAGNAFVVADFSAIEARVIAWLAGERWKVELFENDGKLYETTAERMFNLPPGSVGKGDPARQKGKVSELSCGYGGSVGALINMGALAMGLTESELKPLVNTWRAANPMIVKFWWAVDAAAKQTIRTQAPSALQHGLLFKKRGPLMKLRLPCGRELSYVKPALTVDDITGKDAITYEGTLQKSGGWGRIGTYGATIVENICQAVARDCLAETIMAVETLGYPVVFSVHDELICEVPADKAETALADVLEVMKTPLKWAPGLPLKGDGYICEKYYMKR